MYNLWCTAYRLLGISWVMVNTGREKVWTWKGVSGRKKKQLGLISLTIFWVVWKERNRRTFQGVEEDIDKVKTRWYQSLGFLVTNNSLYSIEEVGNLVDCLIDMKISFVHGLTLPWCL